MEPKPRTRCRTITIAIVAMLALPVTVGTAVLIREGGHWTCARTEAEVARGHHVCGGD